MKRKKKQEDELEHISRHWWKYLVVAVCAYELVGMVVDSLEVRHSVTALSVAVARFFIDMNEVG